MYFYNASLHQWFGSYKFGTWSGSCIRFQNSWSRFSLFLYQTRVKLKFVLASEKVAFAFFPYSFLYFFSLIQSCYLYMFFRKIFVYEIWDLVCCNIFWSGRRGLRSTGVNNPTNQNDEVYIDGPTRMIKYT